MPGFLVVSASSSTVPCHLSQLRGVAGEPDPLQLPPLQLGHCHVGPTRAGPTCSDSTARRPTAAEPRPLRPPHLLQLYQCIAVGEKREPNVNDKHAVPNIFCPSGFLTRFTTSFT